MKKAVLWVIILHLTSTVYADQSITVDAYKDSWVLLVPQTSQNTHNDDWWGDWHDSKSTRSYFHTPHTFENLEPGTYVLIVYLPESQDFDPNYGDNDEASDGLGLENISVGIGDNLELYFKKTDFKVWNCMSCPWLYVFDGKEYIKKTEVLKDIIGCENQTTTEYAIPADMLIDGQISIRIKEEKDEITHIDRVAIMINGNSIFARSSNKMTQDQLKEKDGNHQLLKKGDIIDLVFDIPEKYANLKEFILETEGYYDPDPIFLQQVFKEYLRTPTVKEGDD